MENIRESGVTLLKDRVVIKNIGLWTTEKESKVLTDNTTINGDLEKGTIEAIGVDVSSLSVGDVVVYTPMVGMGFTFNGESYKLAKEENIIGKL